MTDPVEDCCVPPQVLGQVLAPLKLRVDELERAPLSSGRRGSVYGCVAAMAEAVLQLVAADSRSLKPRHSHSVQVGYPACLQAVRRAHAGSRDLAEGAGPALSG